MEISNKEIRHRCYTVREYRDLYDFFKNLPNQEVVKSVLTFDHLCKVNRTMKKRFKNKKNFEDRDCYFALYLTPFEELPTLLGHPNASVGFLASWRILNNKK